MDPPVLENWNQFMLSMQYTGSVPPPIRLVCHLIPNPGGMYKFIELGIHIAHDHPPTTQGTAMICMNNRSTIGVYVPPSFDQLTDQCQHELLHTTATTLPTNYFEELICFAVEAD